MKKWKKLVALALAAILAMSLLTACGGGGGGSSSNTQMEDLIVSSMNGARSKGKPTLTNDAGLRAQCVETLNHIQNGMIQAQYALQGEMKATSDGTGYFQVIIVPTVEDNLDDYPKTALVTPEAMTMDTARKFASNVGVIKDEDDQEFVDSISKIGVATKTMDGKTYMAVAIRFE